MNTWTLSHETTSQTKISESMPNDEMNGVIWLPSLHQDVNNHQPKEEKRQGEENNDKSKKENENAMIIKIEQIRW